MVFKRKVGWEGRIKENIGKDLILKFISNAI